MKGKYVVFFFLIVILGVTVNSFIHCRAEYQKSYNFKITRIRVTPTKTMVFYNDMNEEIQLWNYSIMSNEGVSIGDSISKAPCAKTLDVFRIDSMGKSRLFLRINPQELFPLSWFCD